MKINLDDPNLTAFALGELAGAEKEAMEQAVAESPEAQAHVAEIQAMAGVLTREFHGELKRAAVKPLNILPLPQERSFWSDSRWGSLALAASLAVGAVLAAVVISGMRGSGADQNRDKRAAAESVVQMEVDSTPPAAAAPGPTVARAGSSSARIGDGGENPFVAAATNPRSTFPVNVSTASYADVRRFIEAGLRPAKEAVRIEEMINYFSYDYLQPEGDRAFSINLDAATCPWQPVHQLVRIGVKGREVPGATSAAASLDAAAPETDETRPVIARDMTVQVEFNPARVLSYRLIGYENRMSPHGQLHDGSGDGHEIRAGHSVTALYEIVPASLQVGAASAAKDEALAAAELLSITLSHKDPENGQSAVVAQSLRGEVREFSEASTDFRFAAAVAQFGMVYRDSPHKGNGSLAAVLELAEKAKGRDQSGYRAGFVELVEKAQTLAF